MQKEYFEVNELKVSYLNEFGYVDKVIVEGTEAHIIDYKFTRGEHSANSPQFWAYCLGVWNEFPEVDKITVHVVMPFIECIDVETFSRIDYTNFETVIQRIIVESTQPRIADFNPGDACTYCARKPTCPALGGMAISVIRQLKENTVSLPPVVDIEDMQSPVVISAAKRVSKVLKAWCEAVDAYALEQAKNGLDIPEFELKERSASFSISDPKKAFEVLSSKGVLNEDEFVSICKVSATALDKMIKSKAPAKQKALFVKEARSLLLETGAASEGAVVKYLKHVKEN
jgi:hypothetical protein